MSRGHDRERAVKRLLEGEGWFVTRAAGSLGDADLHASRAAGFSSTMEPRAEVRIIEVKSTARGPFAGFPPADRAAVLDAAVRAGGSAWLAYWPPRGVLRWIPSSEWPAARRVAA